LHPMQTIPGVRCSLCLLIFSVRLSFALTASPDQLASQYSLSTSTSFPFPAATEASDGTQSTLLSWSLSKGRIQNGVDDLAFVSDPFPSSSNSSSSPVLQVTYPSGSFSHDTGGAQFINLWNTTDNSPFQSMMVSYEVAFDQNFDWVKGGKLPGLRGGSVTGCSGGSEPNGTDCFSARLMWRPDGAGEVYAYIPTPNNLCNSNNIMCNDDFGVSISRGSFSFVSGSWNRITLLVRLNNPPDTANGNIQLYFNDVSVINQTDLQFRSVSSLEATGLFFSTFFGGSDSSWATPQTTHTFFRNLELWGSSNPSDLAGQKASTALKPLSDITRWMVGCSFMVAGLFALL